ncbi:hypothetical protein C8J57DRAFT_1564641 [Mycena rebaudengoi]|nr:hypothetical protein C8J57DRAFT_1564641 [Mycena rebaudengoi]
MPELAQNPQGGNRTPRVHHACERETKIKIKKERKWSGQRDGTRLRTRRKAAHHVESPADVVPSIAEVECVGIADVRSWIKDWSACAGAEEDGRKKREEKEGRMPVVEDEGVDRRSKDEDWGVTQLWSKRERRKEGEGAEKNRGGGGRQVARGEEDGVGLKWMREAGQGEQERKIEIPTQSVRRRKGEEGEVGVREWEVAGGLREILPGGGRPCARKPPTKVKWQVSTT